MDNFDLTPEEVRILQESTPEQWNEALKECAKDPDFLVNLGEAVLTGFLEGLFRGLDA